MKERQPATLMKNFNMRRLKSQRVYDQGKRPCSYCSAGGHKKCRMLRLDGRVCTCACPRASEARSDIRQEQLHQRVMGNKVPTDTQAAKSLKKLAHLSTPFDATA